MSCLAYSISRHVIIATANVQPQHSSDQNIERVSPLFSLSRKVLHLLLALPTIACIIIFYFVCLYFSDYSFACPILQWCLTNATGITSASRALLKWNEMKLFILLSHMVTFFNQNIHTNDVITFFTIVNNPSAKVSNDNLNHHRILSNKPT